MKLIETITEEKVEVYESVILIKCDWCGVEIEPEKGYETNRLKLQYLTGIDSPTSGNLEGWEVQDVCNTCAERLRETLIEKGLNVRPIKKVW